MIDLLYVILDRIRDFLALVGDFFHYLMDNIKKDKGFRIRFIGIIAAAAALVCGIVIFSQHPADSGRGKGTNMVDLVEITAAPVVEEIDPSPTPVPSVSRQRQVDSSAVVTGSGLRQINEYVAAGHSGQTTGSASEDNGSEDDSDYESEDYSDEGEGDEAEEDWE